MHVCVYECVLVSLLCFLCVYVHADSVIGVNGGQVPDQSLLCWTRVPVGIRSVLSRPTCAVCCDCHVHDIWLMSGSSGG